MKRTQPCTDCLSHMFFIDIASVKGFFFLDMALITEFVYKIFKLQM